MSNSNSTFSSVDDFVNKAPHLKLPGTFYLQVYDPYGEELSKKISVSKLKQNPKEFADKYMDEGCIVKFYSPFKNTFKLHQEVVVGKSTQEVIELSGIGQDMEPDQTINQPTPNQFMFPPNISAETSLLQFHMSRLQTDYESLVRKYEALQTKYENTTEDKNKLERELNIIKDKHEIELLKEKKENRSTLQGLTENPETLERIGNLIVNGIAALSGKPTQTTTTQSTIGIDAQNMPSDKKETIEAAVETLSQFDNIEELEASTQFLMVFQEHQGKGLPQKLLNNLKQLL